MNRDDIRASGFWINDIPGEFAPGKTIDIRYTRGTTPYSFSFVVREGREADGKLLPLKNPVAIKIECASANSRGKRSITLKGWYILSRRGMEDGWVQYELVDGRWRQQFNKLTAQYNIKSYGGEYRADSLNGKSPWKALEAAKDALTKLGYTLGKMDVPADLQTVQLPDNLGNSDAGGYATEDQYRFQPQMLEPLRCDTVFDKDGRLMITDRATVRSDKLKKFIRTGGNVSTADVHWQKPKTLVMEAQKKVERRFRFLEFGATTSPDKVNPQIENVIPNWNPADPDAKLEYVNIEDWFDILNGALSTPGTGGTDANGDPRTVGGSDFAKFIGMSIDKLRDVFMAPSLYPVNDSDELTSQDLAILDAAEGLMREHWRLVFRVVPVSDDPASQARARYAGVEINRLGADGTASPDGAVFMDYVVDLRHGQRKKGENPLNATFSENVRFSISKPAPFAAKMLDPDTLVFELVPKKAKFHQKGYYPGLLETPKSHGNMQAALRGQDITNDVCARFDSRFELVVYWFGLWAGSIEGGEQFARTHKVRQSLYPDGEIDELVLRCDELTANFGYTDGTFPGALLNGPQLNEKCTQLNKQVKQMLDQKNAGISRHGGIDVLVDGKVWVGGDIHEIAIRIGERAPASIDTIVTVLPGARREPEPVFTSEPGKKSKRIT